MARSKTYDEEFRKAAVRLSYERGSIVRAARELNIPYPLLCSWRRDYSIVRLSFSNPKTGEPKPKQKG